MAKGLPLDTLASVEHLLHRPCQRPHAWATLGTPQETIVRGGLDNGKEVHHSGIPRQRDQRKTREMQTVEYRGGTLFAIANRSSAAFSRCTKEIPGPWRCKT